MKPEDLLELLDLKESRAGPNEAPAFGVSGTSKPSEAASPTALVVDAWGLRRGSELLDASDRLGQLGLDSWAVADCHAAAFDPEPSLMPDCRDAARQRFFQTMLETPNYRVLHESTKLDVNASEIAAVHFAEELARSRNDAKNPWDEVEADVAALRAVSRAVADARREVEEFHAAKAAFGMGPGGPGSNDAKAIAELFRRIRNSAELRAICTLAGRYRRLAQSRQRRKTRHGLDDVVGVEHGGDLGCVLPHELAKLMMPEYEIEVLRRLVERQLMCREHHAVEPVGKGPILICVDESGSMSGEPVQSAKAIALALAWIARQQRRWCALIAYSGDSGERLLALPPGRWDELALADWLTQFLSRGSTLDVPIRELPQMYEQLQAPVGETDLIVLTDCICEIPGSDRDRFHEWKRSVQARVITLVIGSEPGGLRDVSDEIHLVRSLAIGEESVGRVLSI